MAAVISLAGDEIDVTFSYPRAPGDGEVLLVGGFVQGGRSQRVLEPEPGTDRVQRTVRLPAAYLGTYLFWVGRDGVELPEDFDALLEVMYSDAGRPVPDPDGGERFVYPVDPEHPADPFVQSVLRGPTAVAEPLLGAPLLGTLTEHRIASSHLGDERRVWVHESAGIDPDGPEPALMVVLDGGVFAHLLHTPEQVDALVAAGELPPMITIYCHYASESARNAELLCREEFADFIADELVPWAQERWRFSPDPARSVVAGSSLGGLSAAWLAFRRPERFGHVVALSPSFWWHPDHPARANWLLDRWLESGPRATRLYVDMGTFERTPGADGRSGYDHARDVADAARERGNDVAFEEHCGGHDFLAWRAVFPGALRWIAAGLTPA